MKKHFIPIDPYKIFFALTLVAVVISASTAWFEGVDNPDSVNKSPSLRYVVGSSADACPFSCIRCTAWDPDAWPKTCVGEYICLDEDKCGDDDPGDPGSPSLTPPTASATLTCGTWGASGWCVDNGRVRITATDPEGGSVTISGKRKVGSTTTNFSCSSSPCNVNMVVGEGTVTYRVLSSVSGLTSADQTINFKYDNTKPSVTENVTGTLNGSWYVTNAVIAASSSDTGSGVLSTGITFNAAPASLPYTASADGVHSVTFTVTDRAGNTNSKSFTVRVDKTKPSLNLNASGDEQGGWYRSAVISVSASDATSGVQSILVTNNGLLRAPPFALTDGTHNLVATVTDWAGNTESKSLTVKVDSAGPVITPAISGVGGENGWWVSNAELNASASDALSGLASLQLSKDGGSTWLSLPQTFSDGVHPVLIRARDAAGNETVQTREIAVDTIKPALSVSKIGDRGRGDWHTSPVTIDLLPSDTGSGVGQVEYRMNGSGWISGPSIPAIGDGAHVLEYRVVDVAGNEFSLPASFRVDTKAPTVEFRLPSPGAVVSKTVVVGGVANDETSGVDTLEVSTNGGGNWKRVSLSSVQASAARLLSGSTWTYVFDTSDLPNGEYTLMVRAVDKAGNAASPVSSMLQVNNHGPLIDLTRLWTVMEAGELNVRPNHYEVSTTAISIHDQSGRKVWGHTGAALPVISWNGKFDGELLPAGDYQVIVVACDIHSVCSTTSAVITIPVWVESVATPEPAPSPQPEIVVIKPVVEAAPEPAVELKQIFRAAASSSAARSVGVLILAGAFLFLFASQALGDPRPSAAKSLSRTLREQIMSNKE